MGQQQLLLLVLSTVIVGLATVAGIQAFDENRTQAASDALNQKAAQLAADVKGIYEKPAQFGGLNSDADWSSSAPSKSEIRSKLGIDGTVEVPAADGTCDVSKVKRVNSNNAVSFSCSGTGDYSNLQVYGVFKDTDTGPQIYTQNTDI